MQRFQIRSDQRGQMLDVTERVRQAVSQARIQQGQALVYVPHTTAGVTINENADPDVVHDILAQLDHLAPWSQPFYDHGEGNSAAHVKASLMGASATVIIEEGELVLGTWQGIWFCEFDGPRSRQLYVHCHDHGEQE